MKRMFLAILALTAVSCSSVTEPEPRHVAPAAIVRDVVAPNPDGTCRSGYSVATGAHGETICVSEQ